MPKKQYKTKKSILDQKGFKMVDRNKKYDFAGWATRNDMQCEDGRIIRRNAFKDDDGKKVTLVWNHQHNNVSNVLGHALLENRADGVYAYCVLNDTPSGQAAKEAIAHGDVEALSIYANKLKQDGANVTHGSIKEVSLVMAGANPGALIESVFMQHSDDSVDEEMYIWNDAPGIELAHAAEEPKKEEEKEMAEETKQEGKTIEDVLETLNDDQKAAVLALMSQVISDVANTEDEKENKGDNNMKHNAFDAATDNDNVLSHSDMGQIIEDAKSNFGSLKKSFNNFLAHAVTDANDQTVTYGMANVGYLSPDAKAVAATPDFIARDMGWVSTILGVGGAKHLPFARVKSIHANITMDEARAKGYIKNTQKADEVFALLKRTTDPQTVYKHQSMDRDDVIDITDFNVVSWLKAEMRMMLDEEIARAVLIGDGRSAGTAGKISEDHIRSIYNDDELYTVKTRVAYTYGDSDMVRAKKNIRAIVKARKNYKGSGNPIFYTTEDQLTEMLLIEDSTGRDIYDSVEKLATKLRVSKIVTVPVMEGTKRTDDGVEYNLIGIIVNPVDYNIGADKGGAVNLFDDFDIDYNKEKYLIETRCSGALVKPYSALVIEAAEPAEPEDDEDGNGGAGGDQSPEAQG